VWLATASATRELHDGETVVGGGADADWRVLVADLMPRHFVVIVHGLNAQIRPAAPESVVAVNGRQLGTTLHLLDDGDEILAGGERFVFSESEPRSLPAYTPANDRAYLIDETTKTAHALVNRSTTIGRDPSNAILLRDPTASRFHAEVRREAGGFALHSMGAAGTTVNDKPVTSPVLLADDDIIEVAFTRLRFAHDTSGAAPKGAPDDEHERLWSQRNPTLATAKISVVERDGVRWASQRWLVAVIVLLVAALAVILLTR
jgi:pSer/pThr/pTyr-binding forkhead associated (FHA) protein